MALTEMHKMTAYSEHEFLKVDKMHTYYVCGPYSIWTTYDQLYKIMAIIFEATIACVMYGFRQ